MADLLQDEKRSISPDIPLSVSQSTAVEYHDQLVAVGAAPPGEDIADDATNSCALLAVGIADKLLEEGSQTGRGKKLFRCQILGLWNFVGVGVRGEGRGGGRERGREGNRCTVYDRLSARKIPKIS